MRDSKRRGQKKLGDIETWGTLKPGDSRALGTLKPGGPGPLGTQKEDMGGEGNQHPTAQQGHHPNPGDDDNGRCPSPPPQVPPCPQAPPPPRRPPPRSPPVPTHPQGRHQGSVGPRPQPRALNTAACRGWPCPGGGGGVGCCCPPPLLSSTPGGGGVGGSPTRPTAG